MYGSDYHLPHKKAEEKIATHAKECIKLHAFLQVYTNGKEFQPLITAAKQEWLAKPRWKLAKVLTRDVQVMDGGKKS